MITLILISIRRRLIPKLISKILLYKIMNNYQIMKLYHQLIHMKNFYIILIRKIIIPKILWQKEFKRKY